MPGAHAGETWPRTPPEFESAARGMCSSTGTKGFAPPGPILHAGPPRTALVTEVEVRRAGTRVLRDIRRFGLLPFTDPKATSLVSLVADGPVSGSWWGHPAGQWIYRVGEDLERHPEILALKLWRGKVTLVHRRLWPALVRIGESRAAWQFTGLGKDELQLLRLVERRGSLRTDRSPPRFAGKPKQFRSTLHLLESRMLVLSRSIHTDTGAHALEVRSWASWAVATRTPPFPGPLDGAERLIESSAVRLDPGVGSRGPFGWNRSRARPSRRKGRE
jgi:hypothetical protein